MEHLLVRVPLVKARGLPLGTVRYYGNGEVFRKDTPTSWKYVGKTGSAKVREAEEAARKAGRPVMHPKENPNQEFVTRLLQENKKKFVEKFGAKGQEALDKMWAIKTSNGFVDVQIPPCSLYPKVQQQFFKVDSVVEAKAKFLEHLLQEPEPESAKEILGEPIPTQSEERKIEEKPSTPLPERPSLQFFKDLPVEEYKSFAYEHFKAKITDKLTWKNKYLWVPVLYKLHQLDFLGFKNKSMVKITYSKRGRGGQRVGTRTSFGEVAANYSEYSRTITMGKEFTKSFTHEYFHHLDYTLLKGREERKVFHQFLNRLPDGPGRLPGLIMKNPLARFALMDKRQGNDVPYWSDLGEIIARASEQIVPILLKRKGWETQEYWPKHDAYFTQHEISEILPSFVNMFNTIPRYAKHKILAKASSLLSKLFKAKYTKRTGPPGHYKYEYEEDKKPAVKKGVAFRQTPKYKDGCFKAWWHPDEKKITEFSPNQNHRDYKDQKAADTGGFARVYVSKTTISIEMHKWDNREVVELRNYIASNLTKEQALGVMDVVIATDDEADEKSYTPADFFGVKKMAKAKYLKREGSPGHYKYWYKRDIAFLQQLKNPMKEEEFDAHWSAHAITNLVLAGPDNVYYKMNPHFKLSPTAPKLSRETKEGLNKYVFEDASPSDPDVSKALNDAVDASAPLPATMVSYKGMVVPLDVIAKWEQEKKIVLPSPSSFTQVPRVAWDFAKKSKRGYRKDIEGFPVVLQVVVPKGTKVARLFLSSDTGAEHLLKQGTQIKIHNVRHLKSRVIVEGEVLKHQEGKHEGPLTKALHVLRPRTAKAKIVPATQHEQSPWKAHRDYEAAVVKEVSDRLLELFLAIRKQWLHLKGEFRKSAGDDIFRLNGRIFISPKTGRPLTVKQWKEVVESLDAGLRAIFKDQPDILVKRALLLGKVLQGMDYEARKNTGLANVRVPSGTMIADHPAWEYAQQFGRQRAAALLVGLQDEARKNISTTIIDAIKNKKSTRQLEVDLFDKFADLNRDWRRIAETEIAENLTSGLLLAEEDTREKDETIYMIGISAPGACKECERLIQGKVVVLLKEPNSGKIKVKGEEYDTIWPGKSNVGRKAGAYWPCIPLHPHCRCSWTRFYLEMRELLGIGKSMHDLDEVLMKAEQHRSGKGFHVDVEKVTKQNKNYRKVIFTGPHAQLVLMSLPPGGDIGAEVHPHLDQFIRVEAGKGKAVLNGHEYSLRDGDAIVVPAGTQHNVIAGKSGLKLYTVYTAKQHPDKIVEATKAEAEKREGD